MNDADRRATLVRYTAGQRTNHWIVAMTFVLAALSGLALFHPALFWLSNLFGGGPWTRILHPYLALAMLFAFLFMASTFWKDNRLQDRDWAWLRQIKDVVYNREEYPQYHRRLQAVFAKVKIKLRIVEEYDGFTSLIPAIEAGRGVALVSESFIYSAGKRVKLLRLTPEPKPEIFGMAAPLGPLSIAAEKFWQCAKQAALAIS